MRPMSRTLYLIDGHAQIYRAYYAPFGNLTSPSGEPTRATHVFCQMLLNLVRDRQPDYLAMAMDVSDETVFRKDIYPPYKAHRDPPPEDLPPQAERIVSILKAIGLTILRKERFEADDIFATLVRRLAGEDLHIYLVSRDKDLDQLISPYVSLYDPLKNEVLTPASLFESKGWSPEQAVEAQMLTGDSVDNVPGVAGVGPKTAAKLLLKYGSVAALLAHADELSPKQRENLRAAEAHFDVVRRLVTLRADVPVDFDLETAACERLRWAAAAPIFRELNFRRLLEQLPADGGAAKTADAPADIVLPGSENSVPSPGPACGEIVSVVRVAESTAEYRLIRSDDELAELARTLAGRPEFALDTETTGVAPIDAELVGISLCWQSGQACYIPVRCAFDGAVPLDVVRDRLGPLLADPDKRKVGQNLKYDLIVLKRAGLSVAGPLFDTMIAAFVVDPTRNSYSLDRLAPDLLGHTMIPITALIGSGRDQLCIDQVPLDAICEYAAEDADFTWRLKERLEPRLAPAGVDRLFYDTEMPLVRVLTEMECNGVRIDVDYLAEMGRTLAARVEQIAAAVQGLVGRAVNLDSPKQLSEVLFDQLGFRVVKKTKTGRSTDAETLEVLANETGHELPRLLLEYRELQKLRGTYIEALPASRSRRTGRIHTSYHQTGAITGRLSSSEPNLQNIPVRTELGRQIRRAFVPREPGETLIVADYSQVELRVLAHFSQDEALSAAFAEDRDIHAFVAAQVNGVPVEQVSKEMRSRAKAVNFGIIYGQSAFGLARSTGMGRGEAQQFIDDYFRRYPRIRAFLDACVAEAKRSGGVRTVLGRSRPIPDIDSRNRTARQQAERLAVNTVVQGSAADLIKIAMIRLHERIEREQLPLRMLLQVHDELVCEAPAAEAERMAQVIADVMGGAIELRVPLKVDVAIGRNWLEAKSL